MAKKNKKNKVDIVYSTNPHFKYSYDENSRKRRYRLQSRIYV